MTRPTPKRAVVRKVKAWAVLKTRTGELERFAAEGMAPHYVVYPIKRHMNEDLFAVVPCTITYTLPPKRKTKRV